MAKNFIALESTLQEVKTTVEQTKTNVDAILALSSKIGIDQNGIYVITD